MKYYVKVALQHMAMGLVIPISVIWKLQNGLSLPAALLTESLILLATAVADLPAGIVATKIGNKRSLLAGGILHVAGMVLLAVGSSFTVFVLAALATGIAWAFISGADEAYIHDDFIESKQVYRQTYATATIVDEAFTVAGMLCASLMLFLGHGVRLLFIASAGILIVHLLYTYLVLPESQKLPATHPAKVADWMTSGRAKSKEILKILPIMLAFAVVYEAARPLWQPHLQQVGINLAAFGLVFALLKLASLGGSILARFQEFRPKYLLMLFTIMLGSLLGFGVSVQLISVLALAIYLFTENYFRVYMSSMLNSMITTDRAAMLSFGSVIRNGTGAVIIAGSSAIAGISIFFALLVIVAVKIPAMIYLIRLQGRRLTTQV